MKKFFVLATLGVIFGWCGFAGATTYAFEDMIDDWSYWGFFQGDARWIGQNLTYTHDINDNVNFAAGDLVTEAWLELDFTNDQRDDFGSIRISRRIFLRWDHREFATVGWDGFAWHNLGEVDNGQYSLLVDIDLLNIDGLLDVTIGVSNPLGTATAWLDHSRLYGTAVTATPEPTTLVLLGSGLFGAALCRKRYGNKN